MMAAAVAKPEAPVAPAPRSYAALFASAAPTPAQPAKARMMRVVALSRFAGGPTDTRCRRDGASECRERASRGSGSRACNRYSYDCHVVPRSAARSCRCQARASRGGANLHAVVFRLPLLSYSSGVSDCEQCCRADIFGTRLACASYDRRLIPARHADAAPPAHEPEPH